MEGLQVVALAGLAVAPATASSSAATRREVAVVRQVGGLPSLRRRPLDGAALLLVENGLEAKLVLRGGVDVDSVLEGEGAVVVGQEVTDWSVIPSDNDRVRLNLLRREHGRVLLKAEVLRFPQRLELLVKERQDAEGLRQPARLCQQVQQELQVLVPPVEVDCQEVLRGDGVRLVLLLLVSASLAGGAPGHQDALLAEDVVGAVRHVVLVPLNYAVHSAELRADDPDQVVHVAQDVDAEEGRRDGEDVEVELVVGENAAVEESVDVALDLPFEVGHPPAEVDEEERDGEDDLQAGAGQIAPEADVGEAEGLHELVEVAHVLPGHGVHVLAAEAVLNQELVELLDLVSRRERPGQERKRSKLACTKYCTKISTFYTVRSKYGPFTNRWHTPIGKFYVRTTLYVVVREGG